MTEHPAVEEKRAKRERERERERDIERGGETPPLLSSPPPEMAAGTINSAAGIYYDDGPGRGGTGSKFKY